MNSYCSWRNPMSCRQLVNTYSLTAFETNSGLLVRMVFIVRNTSTICSALNLLILIIIVQNVPERPTPSLHTKHVQHALALVSNVSIYLQCTVMGPLPVLRWTCSNTSIISIIGTGLEGQDCCGHSTYCSCVITLVEFYALQ